MTYKTNRVGLLAALTVMSLLVGSCSNDLFTVTNPGRTLDSDLNDPGLVPALVTGMSHDFSIVHDNNAVDVAMLSDEMAGTGNYEETGLEERGIARRQDFNYNYEASHQARWVAETGIEKLRLEMSEHSDAFNSVQGLYYKVGADIARRRTTTGWSSRRRGTRW